MKSNLCSFVLAVLFGSMQFCSAQINADEVLNAGPCSGLTLTCPDGVANPNGAVDGDNSTYAVLATDLGIASTATLSLGFSQEGIAGMRVSVAIQSDNGILNANVLQCMTFTLFDSKGNVVGQKGGADFANASIADGSAKYNVGIKVKEHAFNIASIKIDMHGLVSLANSIRIYNVTLHTVCADVTGNNVYAYHNVVHPDSAIVSGKKEYALLTPPLILDNSYLDISFPEPTDAGKHIYFSLAQGANLLSVSLLQNLKVTLYNTAGQLVYTKSSCSLADVSVLKNGQFILNILSPAGSYNIARARITLGSLVSLTTMKVYDVFYTSDNKPEQPKVKTSVYNICRGDSLLLNVGHENDLTGLSYQWYLNGNNISGANANTFYAKNPGEYSVLVTDDGGCSSLSDAVILTKGTCQEKPLISATVFPNPFNSYTTLNISSVIASRTEIIVSDKSGMLMETHLLSGPGSVHLLERAPQGIYFVKIISGNTIQTEKIIKL